MQLRLFPVRRKCKMISFIPITEMYPLFPNQTMFQICVQGIHLISVKNKVTVFKLF